MVEWTSPCLDSSFSRLKQSFSRTLVNPFSCQADLLEARICFYYSTFSALWIDWPSPICAGLSGIFLKPSLIHQLVVFAFFFFYLLLIILLRLSRIFTYIYNIHRINTQLYAYQVKLGNFFFYVINFYFHALNVSIASLSTYSGTRPMTYYQLEPL